ncbi:protein kinase domain-containing protein [Microbotryomycetes sp. JL221]|nr:protein kinase domain-containing protein [Microbotryomycetes sp. JL221]
MWPNRSVHEPISGPITGGLTGAPPFDLVTEHKSHVKFQQTIMHVDQEMLPVSTADWAVSCVTCQGFARGKEKLLDRDHTLTDRLYRKPLVIVEGPGVCLSEPPSSHKFRVKIETGRAEFAAPVFWLPDSDKPIQVQHSDGEKDEFTYQGYLGPMGMRYGPIDQIGKDDFHLNFMVMRLWTVETTFKNGEKRLATMAITYRCHNVYNGPETSTDPTVWSAHTMFGIRASSNMFKVAIPVNERTPDDVESTCNAFLSSCDFEPIVPKEVKFKIEQNRIGQPIIIVHKPNRVISAARILTKSHTTPGGVIHNEDQVWVFVCSIPWRQNPSKASQHSRYSFQRTHMQTRGPAHELVGTRWLITSIDKRKLDHLDGKGSARLGITEHLQVTSQLLMPVASSSRAYADVNCRRGSDYYDYEDYEIQWSSHDQYELVKRLGRGKYSEVFEAVDVSKHNKRVVIKVLKPIKSKKIKREVKVLKALQRGVKDNNIIKLLDTVWDPSTKTNSLVFEHVANYDPKMLYLTFTDGDTRYYMYELLKAIDFCHSQGIIHRDIKPLNMLIDPSTRTLKLIDWGLAEFYLPDQQLNCRVASRWYKSPEILLDYPWYGPSLDMWGFGCTIGSILIQKDPVFRGEDTFDQLVKIVNVLGTSDFYKYVDKWEIDVSPAMEAALGYHAKRSWSRFVTPDNQHLLNNDAIDLLEKTLTYDHIDRLTAREAMEHRYFTCARQASEQRKQERKRPLLSTSSRGVTAVFSRSSEDVDQVDVKSVETIPSPSPPSPGGSNLASRSQASSPVSSSKPPMALSLSLIFGRSHS